MYRWLTNTLPGSPTIPIGDQTQAEAAANYETWLSDKIVDMPKPTEDYSLGEMLNMGLRGVYLQESSRDFAPGDFNHHSADSYNGEFVVCTTSAGVYQGRLKPNDEITTWIGEQLVNNESILRLEDPPAIIIECPENHQA